MPLNMKIILTGASGFIGKNFLINSPKNWNITAIYNSNKNFSNFLKDYLLVNCSPFQCDLTNTEQVKKLAKEINTAFDVCLYLAANGDPAVSAASPLLDINQNPIALINFLENFQVKRLIYFSSGAVYDGLENLITEETKINPILPYAISKYASEQYIKFYQSKRQSIGEYVILRFFGAYGPYEPPRKIYSKLVTQFGIKQQNKFTIRGDGKNLIDAMYVEDTIDGVKKVIASKKKNLTVNFCSGTPLTLTQLVEESAKIFNVVDMSISYDGIVPEYITFRASSEKFAHIFDYKPSTSLKDGMLNLREFLKTKEQQNRTTYE